MRKIQLYIISKTLKYLSASLIVSAIFIFVINLFEGINILSKKDIPIADVILRSLYTTPLYVYLLMPATTIIASVLVFNYFKTTYEYKAVLSSGYSASIFLKNIVFSLTIICLFMIFFIDRPVSNLYSRFERKTRLTPEISAKYGKTIINAHVDSKSSISSVYISDISLSKYMYVEKMEWKKNIWRAYGVKKIKPSSDNVIYEEKEYEEMTDLPPPQEIILEELSDTNSYSISELIQRVARLKKISVNSWEEEVLIYFRIGIVLMNIVSVFIAFLIFKTRLINNKGAAVSTSILLSFAIWFVITLFKRTADMELIPPWMIGFIPHILIGIIVLKISSKLELRS